LEGLAAETGVPVERLIKKRGRFDQIWVEKGIADADLVDALPGFRSVNGHHRDDSDERYDKFAKDRNTILARALSWREPQEGNSPEARNLRLEERTRILRVLGMSILMVTVILYFNIMGEDILKKLKVNEFIKHPMGFLTLIVFLTIVSDYVDEITKIENNKGASGASRGDLGIDRALKAHHAIFYAFRWMAWLFLAVGVMDVLKIIPIFDKMNLIFGFEPNTTFVLLGVARDSVIAIIVVIGIKMWWKISENYVRFNPRLARRGFQGKYFNFMSFREMVSAAINVVVLAFFFYYFVFGIVQPREHQLGTPVTYFFSVIGFLSLVGLGLVIFRC